MAENVCCLLALAAGFLEDSNEADVEEVEEDEDEDEVLGAGLASCVLPAFFVVRRLVLVVHEVFILCVTSVKSLCIGLRLRYFLAEALLPP